MNRTEPVRAGTVATTTHLVVIDCAACGVVFGVTVAFDENRRETGNSFHCPNRHSLSYDSTQERELRQLRNQVDRLRDDRAYWKSRHEKTERSRSAIKGHLTRTKRRIANGVCPACNRSFHDVREHMATKHPDYDQPDP